MFTVSQSLTRITRAIKAVQTRTAMWWLEMSDQEQRIVVRRGFATSGAALAAALLLPAFSVSFQTERLEADFRAEARALAFAENAADAVRDDEDASALLQHPWLQAVEYSTERDPRAVLSRYAKRDRDGAAVSTVIDFRPDEYDRAEVVSAEHKCLTQAVYYEAGYERTEGKLAVAEVIMNRVADHRYPNSVCEVVFQGATRTTGCQFTFTCDGALNRRPNQRRWEEAETVAAHVLMDLHERRTGSATHYHATYVDPIWNVGLVRTNKIDTHIFYRFPRGSEWAAARSAVARKQAYRAQLASYDPNSGDVAPEPRTNFGQLSVSPTP